MGVGGVNTVGRKDEASDIEISSGKAKFLAELIAVNDFSGERVWAAKHLAGGIEVALLDLFANASATDGLAVERYGGHAMDSKFQFGPELL